MATLKEIRDKVDARLTSLWPIVVEKQQAYLAKHGRYAQVLVSPETNVEDDGEGTFIKRLPHYENNGNDFEFTIDTPIPMQIEIQQNQRGNERGFTVTVYVTVSSTTYRRIHSYGLGPENVNWHDYSGLMNI